MRWVVCMIALNEVNYLWYSISSVYAFAHKIVIVEGSTTATPSQMVNPENGLSVDGTTQLIQEIGTNYDPDGKILYYQAGQVNDKRDLRNFYLLIIDQYLSKQTDWILVLDADELYQYDELMQLDKYLNQVGNQELVYVFNPELRFWGDFNTIRIINEEEWLKRCNPYYKDRAGKLLGDGGPTNERIFKYQCNMRYITSHCNVCDPQGIMIYNSGTYEPYRQVLDFPRRFHYGWLHPPSRLTAKLGFYKNRGDHEAHDAYLTYLEKNMIVESPVIGVEKFLDEHPSVMNYHPYKNVDFRKLWRSE